MIDAQRSSVSETVRVEAVEIVPGFERAVLIYPVTGRRVVDRRGAA